MNQVDRKELGQEKVGLPIMETFIYVFKTIEENTITGFNKSVADYYIDRVLSNRLIGLIDATMDDASLEKLDKNEVRFITLVLFRDHFKHNADIISEMEKTDWIDQVFDFVFDKFSIPSSKHEKFKEKLDFENKDKAIKWAQELSLPFGFEPFKLFILHNTVVTGVKEDLLKEEKPWWKFW